LITVIGGSIFVVIIGVIFMSLVVSKNKPSSPPYRGIAATPAQTQKASPTATPNLNILEFGGKGTGNGLFQDANSITVDKRGHIYVSDDTLRVQEFDEGGQFLRAIQVPSKTNHYEHARTIDKIVASDSGSLYVAVGGTILIYDGDSTEPDHTLHNAPDYIQDFVLRSDGATVLVSDNGKVETLFIFSKGRKTLKHIAGFHTKTADAALSPADVAVSAIRIAVDGAGNIYSVYAFGDLGSYQLSYNKEELLIFRFTPEGKYVNKFVESMNSCGIDVDNQSNIYVSDGTSILVYSNTGQPVATLPDVGRATAFALDKDNCVYILSDDKVIKRAPVVP
jgi:hypothetical protein